jgi:prepilin peptidase CpaA
MNTSVLAAAAATLLFAFTMVYAAFTDLRSRTIRNGIILFLFLVYVGLAPLSGLAAYEIGLSAAVSFAVLFIGALFFALGWIGGGDVKLAAVTALWFGIDHTSAYFVYTAILGAGFAACIALFRTLPLPDRALKTSWIARLHARGSGVPYGVPMALAALVVLPATRWMTTFV